MATYIRNYKLPKGNRTKKRKALISHFLKEEPGTGKGDDASHYQYNVETYKKYVIYLRRPTQLNKGFDFTVNIRGMNFKKNREYSNPSHQDIFNALACCKSECPDEYDKVKDAILNLYNCTNNKLPDTDAYFLDYKKERQPIQIILLAIKWLFMEQDCAYWNYSGRKMLFDKLAEYGLV